MGALNEAIERVLRLQLQYDSANTEPMAERRRIVTNELVSEFRAAFSGWPSESALKCAGSSGAGNSAKVPWVRVFNPEQSPTPTQGWYVVLLFAADGSSASLSLNQGVTQLSGAEIARNVTSARRLIAAEGFAYAPDQDSRSRDSISLADPGLGAKYERGNILGFEYRAGEVPDDDAIRLDLEWLLDRLAVLPPDQASDQESEIAPIDDDDPDLTTLCAAIYWSPEDVREIFEGLMDESPQIALIGPPGTGKTFVAQHLAAYLLGTPADVKNNPYIGLS